MVVCSDCGLKWDWDCVEVSAIGYKRYSDSGIHSESICIYCYEDPVPEDEGGGYVPDLDYILGFTKQRRRWRDG